MAFLYSLLLNLLYPTSVSFLLLLAAAILWRYKQFRFARLSFWSALAVLLICGNGWVVRAITHHLESQYPPFDSQPSAVYSQSFAADAILVLGGGTEPRVPPRRTVEVNEAGDRLLYGAYLYRQGKAKHIICTGNVGTGGLARRSIAEDMAESLEAQGICRQAIITELKAENTHQHGVYLCPLLQTNGFKRVLLVTSAMHMPRSMGVFRRSCPNVEFIPAPTDFRIVEPLPMPWYRDMVNFIPTPHSYVLFSDATHEYLGILYYKLRGWM